ncbi:hypothetical protein CVP05_11465 [Conservatibacter flavescens]|uniref:Uncharacterized protein n=1 Tax=Conservatibacter flavescens TaxID=28161 RepID=A0A2M8RZT9_9PAST|nr:hypothetical protein CVP05_11465 [Conservatibacter flavescens]
MSKKKAIISAFLYAYLFFIGIDILILMYKYFKSGYFDISLKIFLDPIGISILGVAIQYLLSFFSLKKER